LTANAIYRFAGDRRTQCSLTANAIYWFAGIVALSVP